MGRKRSLELPEKSAPSPSLSNYAFERRKWNAYNELRAGTSYRKAAANHTISYRCLFDYARGKKNRVESHEQYMALSVETELKLADRVKQIKEQTGVFPTQKVIIQLANEAIQEQTLRQSAAGMDQLGSTDNVPPTSISDTWVSKFLKRHPELAYDRRRRKPESSSSQGNTSIHDGATFAEDVLVQWFRDLNKIIDKFHIIPGNIYNMAILGFRTGQAAECKIINRTDNAVSNSISSANFTAIECVCADGAVLDPLIILPETCPHRGARMLIVNTKTGTPDSMACFTWLRDVFDRITRTKPNSNYRLLITDSNQAFDISMLLWAWEHHILILMVPRGGGLSKKLQPLKLGVLGSLKQTLAFHVKQYFLTQKTAYLSASSFLDIYAVCRLHSVTRALVVDSWSHAGIVPRNSNKVLDRMLVEDGGSNSHLAEAEPEVEVEDQDEYMFVDEFADSMNGESSGILFEQADLPDNVGVDDSSKAVVVLEREISSLASDDRPSSSSSSSSAIPNAALSRPQISKISKFNQMMEVGHTVMNTSEVSSQDKTRLLYSLLQKSYEMLVDQHTGCVGQVSVLDEYVKNGHDPSQDQPILTGDLFGLLEDDD